MASDQRKHPNKRTSTQLLASKVIHATTELLEENGPQAVTIRAVAARAQVAPMSVYNHFGDKQGLLHAVVEERFAIMTRALRDISEYDPLARLRKAGTIVHELMQANPRCYQFMWTTQPGPEARNAFTQLIEIVRYGQAAGAVIDVDARSLANAIWACVQGAFSVEFLHGAAESTSSDRVTQVNYDALLDLIERGVRTSETPAAGRPPPRARSRPCAATSRSWRDARPDQGP